MVDLRAGFPSKGVSKGLSLAKRVKGTLTPKRRENELNFCI